MIQWDVRPRLGRRLDFLLFSLLILLGACDETVYPQAGPIPGRVDHVAVVTSGSDHLVYWSVAENAERYIVFWSPVRQNLENFSQETFFFVSNESPYRHTNIIPDQTLYYRVFGLNGSRFGSLSNIARPTALQDQSVDLMRQISPSLFDINDDGCLDAVGAYGDCAGGFARVDLVSQGTSGLLRPGRINRDSRFADVNGDGLVDIFTNVY